MLLVFVDRPDLIKLVGTATIDHMVELGVYQGRFSEHCYNVLRPKRYTLIDFWDYDQFQFVLEDAPQMRHLRSIHREYYSNEPQKVMAEAYENVKRRFAGKKEVEIVKADIAEAADRFANDSIDIIYLDGNHTYEFVLRDLYKWFPKLSKGGLFVCNDFCENPISAKNNLGVMPAFLTFSKRFKTYPIALSAFNWSDFYFSNQAESDLITRFMDSIMASGSHLIDIPNEMLGNFRHRVIEQPGAEPFLIPTLRAQ